MTDVYKCYGNCTSCLSPSIIILRCMICESNLCKECSRCTYTGKLNCFCTFTKEEREPLDIYAPDEYSVTDFY